MSLINSRRLILWPVCLSVTETLRARLFIVVNQVRTCIKLLLMELSLNRIEISHILYPLLCINAETVLLSHNFLLYCKDYCRCFKIIFKPLPSFVFPKTTLSCKFLSKAVKGQMKYRHMLIRISLKNTAIFTLHTIFYINPLKHNLLHPHDKIMAILSLLSSVFSTSQRREMRAEADRSVLVQSTSF